MYIKGGGDLSGYVTFLSTIYAGQWMFVGSDSGDSIYYKAFQLKIHIF